MWSTDDWRALTVPQQHAYQMLVQHERLSYAGTMSYAPGLLAERAAGLTEAKVRAAVRTLSSTRFVVVDEVTHEILVRSYVRHDGALDRANMGKAVAHALGLVMSDTLRTVVLGELGRFLAERPDKAGWKGFAEASPDAWAVVQAIASRMESGMEGGME